MDSVVNWQLTVLSEDIYRDDLQSKMIIIINVKGHSANAECIHVHIKELRKFNLRPSDHFTAVMSLQVAFTVSIRSPTEELLEMLWTLFNPLSAADSGMVASRLKSGGLPWIPVLRSTCIWRVTSHVGKPSAAGQPTMPTQPFIISRSIN